MVGPDKLAKLTRENIVTVNPSTQLGTFNSQHAQTFLTETGVFFVGSWTSASIENVANEKAWAQTLESKSPSVTSYTLEIIHVLALDATRPSTVKRF